MYSSRSASKPQYFTILFVYSRITAYHLKVFLCKMSAAFRDEEVGLLGDFNKDGYAFEFAEGQVRRGFMRKVLGKEPQPSDCLTSISFGLVSSQFFDMFMHLFRHVI